MEDTILSADQTEQATELDEETLQAVHGGINAVKSTIVGAGGFGAFGTIVGSAAPNNNKTKDEIKDGAIGGAIGVAGGAIAGRGYASTIKDLDAKGYIHPPPPRL